MQTGSPCQAVRTGIVRGHSKGLLIIKRSARLFISFPPGGSLFPPAVLSVVPDPNLRDGRAFYAFT
jgi:hypothetical protein